MSLVTAIVLLLMLAALGAFIVSFGTVQQMDSSLDFQGSRAYHAARTGLEYGAYQAMAGVCPVAAVSVALPPASFGNFTAVTVSCSTGFPPVPPTTHDEASVLETLYSLTANACNQPTPAGICPNPAPGANYVERELQMSVVNP